MHIAMGSDDESCKRGVFCVVSDARQNTIGDHLKAW